MTRLALHDNQGIQQTDVWADATNSWDGNVSDQGQWALTKGQLPDQLDETLFIGMPIANRAAVFDPNSPVFATATPTKWTSDRGGRFGDSLTTADSDGDGIEELWIAAPEERQGSGRIYRFASVTEGADIQADGTISRGTLLQTISGADPGSRLGESLVTCGDITGDSRPDVVFTAPRYADSSANTATVQPPLSGTVFIARSESLTADQSETLPTQGTYLLRGESVGSGLGTTVNCSHDLDQDGYADLVIGEPWHQSATSGGRVHIVRGGPSLESGPIGAQATATFHLPASLSGESDDWFGFRVEVFQDTTDSQSETFIAVGAPGYAKGDGSVLIFSVNRELQTEYLVNIQAEANEAHFGRWLASGDFDGDGLIDLGIGSPDRRAKSQQGLFYEVGRSWILLGIRSNIWRDPPTKSFDPANADILITGDRPFQQIGRQMLFVDIDGDGTDSLLLPTGTNLNSQ